MAGFVDCPKRAVPAEVPVPALEVKDRPAVRLPKAAIVTSVRWS
jgi:hypothetical protein